MIGDIFSELAPVEEHDGLLIKRGDKITFGDVNGFKAMGCLALIIDALTQGAREIATMGCRESPQCVITSYCCHRLGIPCHAFYPASSVHTRQQDQCESYGATIHEVRCGFTPNQAAALRDFARQRPFCRPIGFGMQSGKIEQMLSSQAQNIPQSVRHITCPVGSGSNLRALLLGLERFNRQDIRVTGIVCGARPTWKGELPPNLELKEFLPNRKPSDRYNHRVNAELDGIRLHPLYEAKCVGFLPSEPQNNEEMLWIVGGCL